MIIGLFGNLSGGKTCTAVKILSELKQTGKRIISNTPLFNLDARYMTDDEFIKLVKFRYEDQQLLEDTFRNSALFLDEITNIVNAHRSGSDLNLQICTFFMMLGKLDCDLIYTCQVFESQVEKALREVTNITGQTERLDQNLQPILFGSRIMTNKIYIKVTWRFDFGMYGVQMAQEVYDPSPYYDYYLTRKIVLLDRDKYLKQNIKKDNKGGDSIVA